MAIQIPNPGTGDGASGDNEFVLWTKTKDNFSDATHAASKLVGVDRSQVPTGDDIVSSYGKNWIKGQFSGTDSDSTKLPVGAVYVHTTQYPLLAASLPIDRPIVSTFSMVGSTLLQFCYPTVNSSKKDIFFRVLASDSSPRAWTKLYDTGNTTKDTATGFIKASSPVLHVYNDSITKIHEAEQLDITVDKKGVGHYEIHGTTGLRKNDGWFMSPPRDVHGNVLCMVDLEEKDGVIILRTYKKKFDFETVSIMHDYDNPMDIPEGVCVEFRFNDLPQDDLDDIQPEEVDLDK